MKKKAVDGWQCATWNPLPTPPEGIDFEAIDLCSLLHHRALCHSDGMPGWLSFRNRLCKIRPEGERIALLLVLVGTACCLTWMKKMNRRNA
jgi:hypothetical protein